MLYLQNFKISVAPFMRHFVTCFDTQVCRQRLSSTSTDTTRKNALERLGVITRVGQDGSIIIKGEGTTVKDIVNIALLLLVHRKRYRLTPNEVQRFKALLATVATQPEQVNEWLKLRYASAIVYCQWYRKAKRDGRANERDRQDAFRGKITYEVFNANKAERKLALGDSPDLPDLPGFKAVV